MCYFTQNSFLFDSKQELQLEVIVVDQKSGENQENCVCSTHYFRNKIGPFCTTKAMHAFFNYFVFVIDIRAI